MPDIKHIDLFNNQYDNLSATDPIPYPSILINIIPNTEFKQYSNKLQSSEMTVELYLGTEFASSLRSNDNKISQSLEHLSLVDRVFKHLEGSSNNDLPTDMKSSIYEIGTLHRKTVEFLNNYTTIKVTKTSFIFRFADASAYPIYTETNLTDIDVQGEYFLILH
jgi:hypothetical protein